MDDKIAIILLCIMIILIILRFVTNNVYHYKSLYDIISNINTNNNNDNNINVQV